MCFFFHILVADFLRKSASIHCYHSFYHAHPNSISIKSIEYNPHPFPIPPQFKSQRPTKKIYPSHLPLSQTKRNETTPLTMDTITLKLTRDKRHERLPWWRRSRQGKAEKSASGRVEGTYEEEWRVYEYCFRSWGLV